MLAYHNDPALKAVVLAQIQASVASGLRHSGVQILTGDPIQGALQYPHKWGIPSVLADLEAGYAGALPPKLKKGWSIEFMDAIPVGRDLSLVWPRFAVWLLADLETGALFAAKQDLVRAMVQEVGDLYGQRIAGQEPRPEAWRAAHARATKLFTSDRPADDSPYVDFREDYTNPENRLSREAIDQHDVDLMNAKNSEANIASVAASAAEVWNEEQNGEVPRGAMAAAVGAASAISRESIDEGPLKFMTNSDGNLIIQSRKLIDLLREA